MFAKTIQRALLHLPSTASTAQITAALATRPQTLFLADPGMQEVSVMLGCGHIRTAVSNLRDLSSFTLPTTTVTEENNKSEELS